MGLVLCLKLDTRLSAFLDQGLSEWEFELFFIYKSETWKWDLTSG